MADNERNMPTQDPENLENKITDSEAPIGEIAQPDEPVIYPAADEAPAVEAESAPIEDEIDAAEQVDSPEENLEPATEDPVFEESVPEEPIVEESLADEPVAEEENPSNDGDAAVATEQTDEPAIEEVAAQEPALEEAVHVEAPADEPASPVAEEIADEASEDDEDLDGRFEIGVGEDGEIYLIQDGKRYSSSNESDDDPYDKFEDEDEDEEEYVDPEDLIIYDEVVEAIKVEGAKLTNTEPALRNYQRHSRDAFQNF